MDEIGEQIWTEARRELERATERFRAFASPHEGYAVLLEEMDELKHEVWKRRVDRAAMAKEAIQVAAMAVRFVRDCCPEICLDSV